MEDPVETPLLPKEQLEALKHEYPSLETHWIEGIAWGYKIDRQAEIDATPSHVVREELEDLAKSLRKLRSKLRRPVEDSPLTSALSHGEWRTRKPGSRKNFIAASDQLLDVIAAAMPPTGAARTRKPSRVALVMDVEAALRDAGEKHMRRKQNRILKMVLEACEGAKFTDNQIQDLVDRVRRKH